MTLSVAVSYLITKLPKQMDYKVLGEFDRERQCKGNPVLPTHIEGKNTTLINFFSVKIITLTRMLRINLRE